MTLTQTAQHSTHNEYWISSRPPFFTPKRMPMCRAAVLFYTFEKKNRQCFGTNCSSISIEFIYTLTESERDYFSCVRYIFCPLFISSLHKWFKKITSKAWKKNCKLYTHRLRVFIHTAHCTIFWFSVRFKMQKALRSNSTTVYDIRTQTTALPIKWIEWNWGKICITCSSWQ